MIDPNAGSADPSPRPADSGDVRAPFDPPPPGGCGKPLLVMGGAFALLLVTALIVFAFKAGPLLALTFRSVAPAITERLDEEVTVAERQRLLDAFEAAAVKAEKGDLDQTRLLGVQQRFTALAGQPSVSRQEALALAEALEALAGVAPPAPAEGEPAEAEPVAPETASPGATSPEPESADPAPADGGGVSVGDVVALDALAARHR
jgi:hypothetical protein